MLFRSVSQSRYTELIYLKGQEVVVEVVLAEIEVEVETTEVVMDVPKIFLIEMVDLIAMIVVHLTAMGIKLQPAKEAMTL